MDDQDGRKAVQNNNNNVNNHVNQDSSPLEKLTEKLLDSKCNINIDGLLVINLYWNNYIRKLIEPVKFMF